MSSFPKDELTHLYDSTTRWKKIVSVEYVTDESCGGK